MERVILRTSLWTRLLLGVSYVGGWIFWPDIVADKGMGRGVAFTVALVLSTPLVLWVWVGGVVFDQHGARRKLWLWRREGPSAYEVRWNARVYARMEESRHYPEWVRNRALVMAGSGGTVYLALGMRPPLNRRRALLDIVENHRECFDEEGLRAVREFVGPLPGTFVPMTDY